MILLTAKCIYVSALSQNVFYNTVSFYLYSSCNNLAGKSMREFISIVQSDLITESCIVI